MLVEEVKKLDFTLGLFKNVDVCSFASAVPLLIRPVMEVGAEASEVLVLVVLISPRLHLSAFASNSWKLMLISSSETVMLLSLNEVRSDEKGNESSIELTELPMIPMFASDVEVVVVVVIVVVTAIVVVVVDDESLDSASLSCFAVQYPALPAKT